MMTIIKLDISQNIIIMITMAIPGDWGGIGLGIADSFIFCGSS